MVEKKILEQAEKLIKDEVELRKNLLVLGKLHMSRQLNEDLYPDSIEIDLGGPGNRGKFYFNADKPEISLMRLENYFKIVAKRDELAKARQVKSDE